MSLLTPAEAAAQLRISRQNVLALARTGQISHERYGPKLIRFTQADIDEYRAASRQERRDQSARRTARVESLAPATPNAESKVRPGAAKNMRTHRPR